MIRQTRIFVPLSVPFDQETWAETVFARIIRPAVENYPTLHWFWFSRYDCPANMDSGDCDISKIPAEFVVPQNEHHRSIRFRYSVEDSETESFEQACLTLIDQNGCRISDFRNHDLVADLGSDRHIGGDRSPERRQRRAKIIVQLYYATSLLALDALVGPDEHGRFRFEHNDSNDIPHDSSFETPHHVFCNITDVPLRVLVSQQSVGTDWAPPQNPVHAVRVRF